MANFKEITTDQFQQSPFKLIGDDWMLVTAESQGKTNTMTASWGGLGVIWRKNAAFIFIRPQRYTKTFIDQSDEFSLTFFDKSFKKTLSYLGSTSGRDEDKIAKSNLTLIHTDNTPYFEEAKIAILCKKLYTQEFQPECILDSQVDEECYPEKDYHTMYIAEIKKILIKE